MNDPVSAAAAPWIPLDGVTSGAHKLHALPQIPDHELIRCIGRGSYGEVWLGRSVMGTYRAVKIVYRNSFKEAHPFEREFNGIQKFEPISRSHEGLIDILQVGRSDQAGYFYYVMELADDENGCPSIDPDRYVPRTIRSEIIQRGRLPFEDCLPLSLSLTAALSHLHKGGLVHRDIKPANIIFVKGIPKLADIGLVADTSEAKSYVGTEGFIPPEGPGTPRADIYSLGKVLYEIATGKDRQRFPEPPTLLGEFSDREQLLELNEVILKACENDPKKRYPSAEHMHSELVLLQSGKSVKRLHLVERRLKIMTRIGVGTVAIMVFGAIPYFLAIREARLAKAMSGKEAEQRERADREAHRARLAETDAREKLRGSYLAQAQAGRWSRRAGRRFDSLDALREAAEIRPSLELRNEAIACLALPDLRLSRELEIRPGFGGWVVFDSNSERYACGDERGNISVLAVADNRELAFLPGFGSNVHAMYFSPDKRLLAVSYTRSDSIELRIWDLAQEKIVSIPPVQNFRNLALSPDSRLAAIAQDHGPILIYDLTLDRTARSFPQESPVNGVAFHPTGRTLAVCRMGTPVVQLLDLETGTTVRSFTNSDVVFCLAWNTDGSSLAAGGKDGRIRIWDADTGRMRCTLMGHQSAVIHLSFNHTGDILVSTSWDGRLRLCNAITGAEIFNREIYAGGASLCPDDSWLVCQTAERKIGIFEMASGDECRLLAFDEMAASEPWCCVFDPDGQVLVTAHRAGLRFWNVRNGLPIGFQSIGETHSAFFDSAGKRLVTNGAGGLRRWPMEFPPGDRTGNFKVGAAEDLGWQTDLDQITSMDREAKVLAAVRDGKACVFDLKTRTEKSRFAGEMPFEFAAISGDAKWCAASQWKAKSVRVFDMATGNRIADLPADKVYVAVFSPDNQWLVTGGYEEYCFWNTASWQMSCRLRRARPGYIRPAISFALDSRMAAVADAQKVLLLDPATGRQFASLESREPANVSAIGFNPDGTRLAVCGWNHLIQLWDLRLIRQELAAINLDWELPPYPAPAAQQNSN